MRIKQLANVLSALRKRSDEAVRRGEEGFVPTGLLTFDVGLNTRLVRGVLDEAVRAGALERRLTGYGNGYSYRPV